MSWPQFILSVFGSLWLLSGIASLGVIQSTPDSPDPDDKIENAGMATVILSIWIIIFTILGGPIFLFMVVINRNSRIKEVKAVEKAQKAKEMLLSGHYLKDGQWIKKEEKT